MKKELYFMSDLLNRDGVQMGGELRLIPFCGRSQKIILNRTQIDFVSPHFGQKSSACIKVLESVQKESFHYRLKLVDTVGRNNKSFKRYMLRSCCDLPFKLNGSFVYESFIEEGDLCELAYHKLQFTHTSPEKLGEGLRLSDKLCRSTIPVLIQGETGTGKSFLAKKIHERSKRLGSFVHVNLCSFSPNLIESELFGHIKGAFTGAISDKKGALREADGGTLFLDEIDSLSVEMQTKLLLFLEDFKLRPVGSGCSHKVDTRIICASGKNLKGLVEKGLMRSDFYFRISSGELVNLKSLRQDQDKLEQLLDLYTEKYGVYFTQELKEFYKKQNWPGNIRQFLGHLDRKRQLSNSRKFILDEIDNRIIEEGSFFKMNQYEDKFITLEELKRSYAQKVFYSSSQNFSLASRSLGISIRSLKRLINPEQLA